MDSGTAATIPGGAVTGLSLACSPVAGPASEERYRNTEVGAASTVDVLYAFDRDGAGRSRTVSQRVDAERVGTAVGDPMAARSGKVRSEVVAGDVEQVVAWRPDRNPNR